MRVLAQPGSMSEGGRTGGVDGLLHLSGRPLLRLLFHSSDRLLRLRTCACGIVLRLEHRCARLRHFEGECSMLIGGLVALLL